MKGLTSRLRSLPTRYTLWAIALVSFGLQLVFMRAPVIYGEPYLVAKNIVAGKGFVFTYPLAPREEVTSYVTPLYTWLQVPFLWSGLGERGIQIMNLLFLQLACYVLYRFFRDCTNERLAMIAFVCLEFYVPFWILGYALDPNTLNILLLSLTAYKFYQCAHQPERRDWLTLGILFGVQLLVRPDVLIGFAVLTVWLLVSASRRVTAAKTLVFAGLLGLLIVSPWTIRNYIEYNRFVLVSANGGYNLYVGNNPVATGEFSEHPATNESREEYSRIASFAQNHNSVDLDAYRGDLARKWMAEHPAELFRLDARKFIYHWLGRLEFGTQYHYQDRILGFGYMALSLLLVALGGYGLYCIPNRHFRGLVLSLFLYSSAVSVIFFVQSRHRTLKVDPFLVPIAAVGASGLYHRVRGVRDSSRTQSVLAIQ